jgi:serine protease inhibitor ecotin
MVWERIGEWPLGRSGMRRDVIIMIKYQDDKLWKCEVVETESGLFLVALLPEH